LIIISKRNNENLSGVIVINKLIIYFCT